MDGMSDLRSRNEELFYGTVHGVSPIKSTKSSFFDHRSLPITNTSAVLCSTLSYSVQAMRGSIHHEGCSKEYEEERFR